jgi:poly(A) polymerase Pap1
VIQAKANPQLTHSCLYALKEFGSTLLGVDNHKSDLDLLIATFDTIFDRRGFFQAFEKVLATSVEVSDIVMVWAANVPLAKFKVREVAVDLIFADFLTPSYNVTTPDYFLKAKNICPSNSKSLDCINSLLSMQELQRIVL